MKYSNHDLRFKIQEYKDKLRNTPPDQFSFQIQFFILEIDSNLQFRKIINEAVQKFHFSDKILSNFITSNNLIDLKEIEEKASFSYHLFKYLNSFGKSYQLLTLDIFKKDSDSNTCENILNTYVFPIIDFVFNSLDESSTIIHLFEQYKKKTERFTHLSLKEKYLKNDIEPEKLFIDDLKKFFLEQDINVPFIDTKSLLENIDSNLVFDPVVATLIICDDSRNSSREQLKNGFSEALEYTDKFDKNTGYLIVFNLNNFDIKRLNSFKLKNLYNLIIKASKDSK